MVALILVVDDDEPVRVMLARLLTTAGYQVHACANAAEARAWLESNEPDLLVTDIVMPGDSGIELRRFVSQRYPHVPAILISGYSAEEPAEFAARQPDTVFIPKPFTADELLELVERMLPEEKLPRRTRS